jgi:hypothetical protein
MEDFLRLQRLELVQQGSPDWDNDEWDVDQQQQPENEMALMDDEEVDGLEEADLAFITSILESFSRKESRTMGHIYKTKRSHEDPFGAYFPPEGALMQKYAKQQMTPPNFYYNSMIKIPTAEQISYSPTVEEEGTEEFLEESDNDKENYAEGTAFENTPTICSITEEKENSFAAWQPFIPSNWQGSFYQNSHAQPCWQFSSAPLCSSLEPTPTSGQTPMTTWSPAISVIDHLPPEETIETSPRVHPDKATTPGQDNQ